MQHYRHLPGPERSGGCRCSEPLPRVLPPRGVGYLLGGAAGTEGGAGRGCPARFIGGQSAASLGWACRRGGSGSHRPLAGGA